jgi:hypothetical protein
MAVKLFNAAWQIRTFYRSNNFYSLFLEEIAKFLEILLFFLISGTNVTLLTRQIFCK